MACHESTQNSGIGRLRTIGKYSGQWNCALACAFPNCSGETFSSLRQSLITNLAAGNLNRTTIWKSGGRLQETHSKAIDSMCQYPSTSPDFPSEKVRSLQPNQHVRLRVRQWGI